MISKKSRKVVAALLIGATVCASGTFAYFNQKIDLSDISSVADGTDQTLQITNGKIEISAKFAGTDAINLTNVWAYDVAKVSTADEVKKAAIAGTLIDLKTRLGIALDTDFSSVDASTEMANLVGIIKDDTTYIVKHRTPDLKKSGTDTNGDPTTVSFDAEDLETISNVSRLKIGTKIPSKVLNARPGDAFVLGYVDGTTKPEDAGVEIVNNSNLTTKIGVGLNPGAAGDYAEVKAEVARLNANGWKVYVRVVDAGTKVGIGTYADWKEITNGLGTATDGICEVATVAPGTGVNPLIQLRVELPLLTNNKYQDLTTGETGKDADGNKLGTPGTFDITNLFEIVATQENNPGWNQNGSTTRPISSDVRNPSGGVVTP